MTLLHKSTAERNHMEVGSAECGMRSLRKSVLDFALRIRRAALQVGILVVLFRGCVACPAESLVLFTNAQVTSAGVFLADIVAMDGGAPPHLRVCDAPAFGQAMVLGDAQLRVLVTNRVQLPARSGGVERVRITRRARPLLESELREQLTAALQHDSARDRGDLELRFTRPWNPVNIPDEPYTIKILDLPASGVSASFIVRFELITDRDNSVRPEAPPAEPLGPWQVPVAAKIWREVWVAHSALKREQLFVDADVVRERRDVLALREAPFAVSDNAQPEALEIAEHVPAGSPIYARALRLHPVVRRGQVVDAELQDGAMSILLKVEVLESGAPGQLIRVRNLQSRREFKGKVQNEQTVLVLL